MYGGGRQGADREAERWGKAGCRIEKQKGRGRKGAEQGGRKVQEGRVQDREAEKCKERQGAGQGGRKKGSGKECRAGRSRPGYITYPTQVYCG